VQPADVSDPPATVGDLTVAAIVKAIQSDAASVQEVHPVAASVLEVQSASTGIQPLGASVQAVQPADASDLPALDSDLPVVNPPDVNVQTDVFSVQPVYPPVPLAAGSVESLNDSIQSVSVQPVQPIADCVQPVAASVQPLSGSVQEVQPVEASVRAVQPVEPDTSSVQKVAHFIHQEVTFASTDIRLRKPGPHEGPATSPIQDKSQVKVNLNPRILF
jgi:hypothetical protein